MFTGLVIERGRVAADLRPLAGGAAGLSVEHSAALAERLGLGASLAISGVCLTVVASEPLPAGGPAGHRSDFEMVPETLARTTLGGLRHGDAVNLEPALRMGDALGGHLVQGHVDGTAAVVGRRDAGENRVLGFSLPPELAPYLVEKGSITVDGVSLTVAAQRADRFEVALIPHTLSATTLGALEVGDRVNLEVDVLAKYVHQALATRGVLAAPAAPAGPRRDDGGR